ncbi:MAG: cache domain-containing protein, partial [Spirochaetaceae bacterium]|nr:cache domain-containing protein [Spirochaetaceae bacterium]
MNRKAMRKKVKHPQVKERTRFRVSAALVFINAFFIIVSAAFILISMWINSEKNLRDLSRTLINEIQQSVSTRTHSYFAVGAEVNKGLSFLLYHFFENPVANERDGQNTFKYYGELMNIYPQFKMLYYSDTQGNLIMLNRMADGSHSRRFVNNTGDYIRTRWEHHNPAYYSHYPNSNEMAESGYDPRRRIWYRIAQEAKELVWTPVYLFATDHLPGFTCAAPVFDNFGNMIGVSSVDIAVNELSRFLAGVQPTPGTRVFILDKENNLVAIQAKKDEDFEKLFEKKIDQYGGLTYNIASLDVYPDDTSRIILKKTLLAPEKYTRITHQGSNYISMISPMSIGNGLDLNIGIIIPENDIIGNMRMNMRIITMFSGAFLVLIVLISGVISRAIAR